MFESNRKRSCQYRWCFNSISFFVHLSCSLSFILECCFISAISLFLLCDKSPAAALMLITMINQYKKCYRLWTAQWRYLHIILHIILSDSRTSHAYCNEKKMCGLTRSVACFPDSIRFDTIRCDPIWSDLIWSIPFQSNSFESIRIRSRMTASATPIQLDCLIVHQNILKCNNI